VIAAYNCGPENINRAIHRAGGERDYWKIYPYLPKETRGYVPAFIAANYIMNYYCEHNICPMRTQLPAKSDTVVVNRDVHLKQVAAVCQLSLEELRTLNPQYRRDIVNGSSAPSIIRLPEMAVNTFIDYEDSIYNYNTETLLTKRSEVAVEEAKPEVMRYTPTTYTAPRQMSRHERRALAASNKSSRHDRKVSREERRSKHKAEREDRHSRKHQKGKGKKDVSQSVTIKEGQTLSEIARKNHTTVDKLKKLNGIKGSNIRAGKKLKVK
jgi:membrane-bound lytic murein transglycosylase D